MPYLEELDLGGEIKGVVCPKCGGSLVWRKGRAYCYEDRYVNPVDEPVLNVIGSSLPVEDRY